MGRTEAPAELASPVFAPTTRQLLGLAPAERGCACFVVDPGPGRRPPGDAAHAPCRAGVELAPGTRQFGELVLANPLEQQTRPPAFVLVGCVPWSEHRTRRRPPCCTADTDTSDHVRRLVGDRTTKVRPRVPRPAAPGRGRLGHPGHVLRRPIRSAILRVAMTSWPTAPKRAVRRPPPPHRSRRPPAGGAVTAAPAVRDLAALRPPPTRADTGCARSRQRCRLTR